MTAVCPHSCCCWVEGTVHTHARPASTCRFCHYRNAGNPGRAPAVEAQQARLRAVTS